VIYERLDQRAIEDLYITVNSHFSEEEEPSQTDYRKILNVSYGGLAFQCTEDDDFHEGDIFSTKIFSFKQLLSSSLESESNTPSVKIAVEIEITRINDQVIGAKFLNFNITEFKKLAKYLEPQYLGNSLKVVNDSVIPIHQKDGFPYSSSIYFQGINDTHLFLWLDDQEDILKIQLFFLGNVVQWKYGYGAITWKVPSDRLYGHEDLLAGLETPSHGAQCSDEIVNMARNIVSYIQTDKKKIKNQLKTLFTKDYPIVNPTSIKKKLKNLEDEDLKTGS
jgi:hypothetical protein